MSGRRATGGEQGLTVPTLPRNTSHLLCDAIPVTPGLAAVDTGGGGKRPVAPRLPIIGVTIVGALDVLLSGGLVIQSLVAKL